MSYSLAMFCRISTKKTTEGARRIFYGLLNRVATAACSVLGMQYSA